MTKQKKITFWIEKAQDDLDSARIMYNAGKYLYTGFMIQQCIEKVLKGYYIHVKDKRHPHEHNVIKLAKTTGLFEMMDESQKRLLEKIDPLYIQARYDDYKMKINALLTVSYCKTLINETEVLLEWIITLMK